MFLFTCSSLPGQISITNTEPEQPLPKGWCIMQSLRLTKSRTWEFLLRSMTDKIDDVVFEKMGSVIQVCVPYSFVAVSPLQPHRILTAPDFLYATGKVGGIHRQELSETDGSTSQVNTNKVSPRPLQPTEVSSGNTVAARRDLLNGHFHLGRKRLTRKCYLGGSPFLGAVSSQGWSYRRCSKCA